MRNDNIKIFFFDNDGTLFDHMQRNAVSEMTMEALKKLKENGYKICLNTSRSPEEMYNTPKELMEIMDCVILMNGAYIIYEGKVEIKELPYQRITKVLQYLEEHNCTCRYVTSEGKGYLNRHDESKEGIFKYLYDMIPTIKEYQGERLVHLLSYCLEDDKNEVLRLLGDIDSSVFTITSVKIKGNEGYNAIESAPKGCNKGEIMEDIASRYGYTLEECCAFGDGVNDLEAIKLAGLGVAMGNGRDVVKQAADYVTEDTLNEGVYKALKHFGFI